MRGLRLEECLVILLGLTALCTDLVMMRVGLDPQDEGYFLEQATRVLRGDLPYRDFDSLYTPGLLYLHAALLHLAGGPNVLVLRAIGFVARVLLACGLYALCRPLARPMFAIVPALYVLVGLDRIPETWEPHPGWPSAALTALTVLAFSRLPVLRDSQRRHWLIGIGATTALVFLFKQNAGVFLGLALVVYTAVQGIDGMTAAITPVLRVTQIGLIGAVALAVAWLISPHASPMVAAYFLGPVVATAAAPLWTVSISRRGRGLDSLLTPVGLLAMGFCVVTLPWVAALIAALDGQIGLLSAFVGGVDQDILWHPLQGPNSGAWASLLGCTGAVVLAVRVRRNWLLRVAVMSVAAIFAVCAVLLAARPGDGISAAVLLWPVRAADHLQGVLPLATILAGVWWCCRAPPGPPRWQVGWLTVASALTFLSEYPRIDEVHLAWSACLALAIGAILLDKLQVWLTQRWHLQALSRSVLIGALLAVPLATTFPNLGERSKALLDLSNGMRLAPLSPVTGLSGVDGVLVRDSNAKTLVAAAEYVRSHSTPGEPIFVYPTTPLLYVMTDRPNPTRFAHLYPGAASTDELNTVISTLQHLPVRIVVVNDASLAYWSPPGSNQPLEDYLATTYQAVARFGDYRVLIEH